MSRTKKTSGRVLRFAVSGMLLVGAGSIAACDDEQDDGPTINEPYEEPTPNSPALPPEEERVPGEESSNEPAPVAAEEGGDDETIQAAIEEEAE